MLVDSHKFDLSEPLLFHLPYSYEAQWKLSLVPIDAIGMAMLIDSGSDIDDPNSYQLLTTLVRRDRSSGPDANPLNTDMRLFVLGLEENYADDCCTSQLENCVQTERFFPLLLLQTLLPYL